MPGKAKGCLTGCLVFVLVTAIVLVGAIMLLRQYMLENFLERMERQGYKVVRGDVIDVDQRISEPTVYAGKLVMITRGSERGVAIVAQSAEIDGHFKGNVRFFGQTLTVARGTRIDYDLHAFAQLIHLHGTVEGEITGIHLELNQ